MTQLTEQILSLSDDQKIRLIHAISEQLAYPTAYKPLGFHVDRLPDAIEPQITMMLVEEKKDLIKTIVNHF